MSAFMVGKEHIDVLVSLAVNGPSPSTLNWRSAGCAPYFGGSPASQDRADEIGDALVLENLHSIHARYPDTIGPETGPAALITDTVLSP